MKVLFIEARKKNLGIENFNLSILPKDIFLAYSVQFKELAEKLKIKLGARVKGFQQVLGCSKLKINYPILLVSSGKFHALNLALQGNSVYILDNEIKKLDENQVEKLKLKRKAALSRFLASQKIGILVSSKPGQENLETAINLKKKLEKKGKEASIFLADNINSSDLENFNIDSWLNTSCPSLSYDSRILNQWELEPV